MSAAIKRYGRPEIINSDQGSQFTSTEYTDKLKNNHIRQSMDGKARWVDNVIIERWFRSLKIEYVYINELETPRKLRVGIAGYIAEYNHERPHQSHDYKVPYEIFKNGQKRIMSKAA